MPYIIADADTLLDHIEAGRGLPFGHSTYYIDEEAAKKLEKIMSDLAVFPEHWTSTVMDRTILLRRKSVNGKQVLFSIEAVLDALDVVPIVVYKLPKRNAVRKITALVHS